MGGGGLGPPSSQGYPMVLAEGGPNILKLQSSWHRRRRSKIFGSQPQTLEGAEVGGGSRGGFQGGGGGVPPPLLLRCTAVLIHDWAAKKGAM